MRCPFFSLGKFKCFVLNISFLYLLFRSISGNLFKCVLMNYTYGCQMHKTSGCTLKGKKNNARGK